MTPSPCPPFLSGKTVWVTGSARRLGRAIALACAGEGADVAVHCNRSRAEGEDVCRQIEAMGRRALLVQGDVADHAAVFAMAADIGAWSGRIDALVCSAAVYPKRRFDEIGPDELQATLAANLMGPFWCVQAALPLLRAAKPGRVVFLSDWAIDRPYKNLAHYMASKGGLRTLGKALAKDLAPDVLVNDVAPGAMLPGEGASEEHEEEIARKVPLGRWGGAEPIAKAVLALLDNDYITGTTITVDGGWGVS